MEEKPSESDKYYLKIKHRWLRANLKFLVIPAVIVAVAWILTGRLTGLSDTTRTWLLGVSALVCLTYAGTKGRMETVQKLTDEDYQNLMLVEKTSQDTAFRRGAAQLLKTSEKVHPKREYLRAST